MDNFKKLLDKKKSEGKGMMSPNHMKAKAHVLGGLMNELNKMGAEDLGGLKKVTVASNSPEGLEHGLHKASEMVQKGPLHAMSHDEVGDSGNEPDMSDGDEYSENHDSDEDPAHEAMESEDTETAEHFGESGDEGEHESFDKHEQSPEELKSRIAELEHELAKHQSSKFMG